MTRIILAALGFAALSLAALGTLGLAVPASAAGPVNRWGLDYNRPTHVPRAADPYVHKPPVRVYRKPKPKPVPEAEVPRPRYGEPKPAIERIPRT
jgi:hypothetical protein